MLLLASVALASDVQLGGAIDLFAGVDLIGDVAVGRFAVRQAEGDLRVGSDAIAFEAQVDLSASIDGDGLFIGSLAPERLTVGGAGDSFSLWGGAFQAPWRMESVDPWRSTLVRTSLISARVPGTLLGLGARLGSSASYVDIDLGWQPRTLDVFLLDDYGVDGWPLLVGARGGFQIGNARLGGGGWLGGSFNGVAFGGLEIGADADLGAVAPYGEVVTDLSRHSVLIGAELFPSGDVVPATRVEFDTVAGFGVGVGVAATLFDILRLKAEASYQAGSPGIYAELAVFSAWPADDDAHGFPTDLPRAPKKQSGKKKR